MKENEIVLRWDGGIAELAEKVCTLLSSPHRPYEGSAKGQTGYLVKPQLFGSVYRSSFTAVQAEIRALGEKEYSISFRHHWTVQLARLCMLLIFSVGIAVFLYQSVCGGAGAKEMILPVILFALFLAFLTVPFRIGLRRRKSKVEKCLA